MKEFELHPQLAADTFLLADLPLSRVLLMNEQQFPWLILVPRLAGISEIFQLSLSDRQQLEKESTHTAQTMMSFFNGEKMNTAALGNMVPQLHLHHVVRNSKDSAWPAPVWGNFEASPYTQSKADSIVAQLQPLIMAVG